MSAPAPAKAPGYAADASCFQSSCQAVAKIVLHHSSKRVHGNCPSCAVLAANLACCCHAAAAAAAGAAFCVLVQVKLTGGRVPVLELCLVRSSLSFCTSITVGTASRIKPLFGHRYESCGSHVCCLCCGLQHQTLLWLAACIAHAASAVQR